jgi:hypothetical protein|tara:strand:+ start:84 stop:368 length:285 start_codon:yes stop_codon:yes gene_type:complete
MTNKEIKDLSKQLSKDARRIFEEKYYLIPKDELLSKEIHSIQSSYSKDGETTFMGKDEMGEEFSITFDTIELLRWSDISWWKEKAIKFITDLKC